MPGAPALPVSFPGKVTGESSWHLYSSAAPAVRTPATANAICFFVMQGLSN